MKIASKLSEQGYWVCPLFHRLKFPTKFNGISWTDFIREKDQELLHAILINAHSPTGAALCLRTSDKVPLMVMDIDAYGLELEDIWTTIGEGEGLSKSNPVVRSVSGGWHIYFRLPEGTDPSSLPTEFDLGSGISGEVRASGKRLTLITLPETTSTSKQGLKGTYDLVQGSFSDLKAISLPPDGLLTRLKARKTQGDTTASEPTEIVHLLDVVSEIDIVNQGGRNNFVAKLGQVIGRIHPAPDLTDKTFGSVQAGLEGKLGADFDPVEMRVALTSGYRTGKKNAETYTPHEKHPSVTDIKAECGAVFGSVPWLVEVRDSMGKTKEWLVGYGASAKLRHEATRIIRLKDIRDILPALTRLTGASMDTVSRSPLFIQPGWTKALEYMLSAGKAVDQLGIPPEEKFFDLINEWARIAAQDGKFLEAWTAKRSFGTNSVFICWPLTAGHVPSLAIPPALQEALIVQVGDIPQAQKLVRKTFLKKSLVGMKGKENKVWHMPLSELDELVHIYCTGQYEKFVRDKP